MKLFKYLVAVAISTWMFGTAAYILNRSLPLVECLAFGLIVTAGGIAIYEATQCGPKE